MTETTKIIKYFAIALASLLIVTIISFSISLINSLFGVKSKKDIELFSVDGNYSDNISIDLRTTNLIINRSDKFSIETNNKNLDVTNNSNELIIEEKKHNFFAKYNYELIINIPNEYLNELNIVSSAGTVDINDISVNKFKLDMQTGKVSIDNLKVLKESYIDGGAGKMTILNSNLNNLELDLGIGKCTIEGIILGNSKIDAGIGELIIDLKDDDIEISASKGIGNIKINDELVIENKTYGTSLNKLFIDGGIGVITVNTIFFN